MQLYCYAPVASLAPLIVAREIGVEIELVAVDPFKWRTAKGEDYASINGKCFLPAIKFDDGAVLTEMPVMMEYLANLRPEAGLHAPAGTMKYYRIKEWMCYFASEMHKLFTMPFWDIPEEAKDEVRRRLRLRTEYIEKSLNGKDYLVDNEYSVADIYLFIIIRAYSHIVDEEMTGLPNLSTFKAKMADRELIQKAIADHEAA